MLRIVLAITFCFEILSAQTRVSPGQIGPIIPSASTLTVPSSTGQYAGSPWFGITGNVTVTAVAGPFPLQEGTLTSLNGPVRFSIGSTIGATCTTISGATYSWIWDGALFWVVGPGCITAPGSFPFITGYVLDSGYPTLATGCAAAVTLGRTLLLTKLWSSLTTQALACNIQAFTGGIIKPASGQTVTLTGSFSGDLSKHVDISAGGSVVFAGKVDSLYPQWFGALCGGADDTVAVQNTFNALSTLMHRVTFVCQSTVTNVWVPTSAGGAIIEGMAYPVTHNAPAVGSATLIAKAGTTGAVLSIYAPAIHLTNFLVNCGPSVAQQGLVFAGIIESQLSNYGAESCIDDGEVDSDYVGTFSGGVMTPNANTSTTLTSQMSAGAHALAVTSVTLQGMTLGGVNCGGVVIEYGTVRQEQFGISSVVGTTINISGSASFTHAIGSSALCTFNNNGVHASGRTSTGSGGWGRDMLAGSDQNNWVDENFTDFANTAGGVLASGSVLNFRNGHSEANSGPALQLGDASALNVRSVIGSQIDPFLDLENSTAAYNAVTDLCGLQNTIRYKIYTEILFPASGTCSLYGNSSDLAYGASPNPSNTEAQFSVQSAAGLMEFQPAKIASSIGVQRGILFSSLTSVTGLTINTAGSSYTTGDIVTITQAGCAQAQATLTVVATVVAAATPLAGSQGMGCTVGTALPVTGGSGSGLLLNITTIGRSNQAYIQPQDWWTQSLTVPETRKVTDYSHSQFSVSSGAGVTGIGYTNMLGFNSATLTGFLQSALFGTTPEPLRLNPLGGVVTIGSSTSATNMRAPTSCSGLASGTLWNNSGTAEFCP